MKIKAKLFAGVGVLFAMVVLLMIVGTVFINRLSGDTRQILVANYNTLDYSRKMLDALNEGIDNDRQAKHFAENLALQQVNITEVGEKELTDKLAQDYQQLQAKPGDSAIIKTIRTDISDIMLLNMQAIQRKSKVAETTAEQSIFWVSLIGAVCFLVAFVLLVNLPGNIANPIREFSESIKQISAQNYTRRIHYDKHNEFGELAASFNTMAEKLEEFQRGNLQKLLVEKKRIETLINNMQDPVIGLDEKNRILFMNNTALKIAGLRSEEVTGVPAQDVAVKNDLVRALVRDLFSEFPASGEPAEPMKIYADNKESYFNKHIIPIRIVPTGEQQEEQIGNVIVLQNITSFKELDFAKTNFIATVSHELKTPIASIQMSLQLLENQAVGTLNSEQQHLLHGIRDDAGRLLKITGELLNMAQVETGSIQISVSPQSVREILDYAVSSNQLAADSKKISLRESLPSADLKVLADKDKTSWVLTNLVSNAIRYSYENASVQIQVAREGRFVRISVADTGQGIAPEYIGKIFDRYFRIPGTRKEGTGLGLSISKEFIEAQGGSISVQSELAAGSAFSITIPAAD